MSLVIDALENIIRDTQDEGVTREEWEKAIDQAFS